MDQLQIDEFRKNFADLKNQFSKLEQQILQSKKVPDPVRGLSNNHNERVVCLMDQSNLFATVRNTFDIDYRKLRDFLINGRIELDTRVYYSERDPATLDAAGVEFWKGRQRFYHWLRRQGFNLIELPRVQRGQDIYVEKGLDAEIVADMLTLAAKPNVDTLILVSGDGDYSRTIQRIRSDHYRRIEVAFFAESTSRDLFVAGSSFVNLSSYLDRFRRISDSSGDSTEDSDERQSPS